MSLDVDDEPIPAVPWAERVKEMKRIRDDVGEHGFVQLFLCIMGRSETHNCRVILTRRRGKAKRSNGKEKGSQGSD